MRGGGPGRGLRRCGSQCDLLLHRFAQNGVAGRSAEYVLVYKESGCAAQSEPASLFEILLNGGRLIARVQALIESAAIESDGPRIFLQLAHLKSVFPFKESVVIFPEFPLATSATCRLSGLLCPFVHR